MPRPISRHFTQQDISNFHRWRSEGLSTSEISLRLGVRPAYLNHRIADGTFGKLQSRQGQQKQHTPRGIDDPAKEILFGMGRRERERRMKKIQDSWTDDERHQRTAGFQNPHHSEDSCTLQPQHSILFSSLSG